MELNIQLFGGRGATSSNVLAKTLQGIESRRKNITNEELTILNKKR